MSRAGRRKGCKHGLVLLGLDLTLAAIIFFGPMGGGRSELQGGVLPHSKDMKLLEQSEIRDIQARIMSLGSTETHHGLA